MIMNNNIICATISRWQWIWYANCESTKIQLRIQLILLLLFVFAVIFSGQPAMHSGRVIELNYIFSASICVYVMWMCAFARNQFEYYFKICLNDLVTSKMASTHCRMAFSIFDQFQLQITVVHRARASSHSIFKLPHIPTVDQEPNFW